MRTPDPSLLELEIRHPDLGAAGGLLESQVDALKTVRTDLGPPLGRLEENDNPFFSYSCALLSVEGLVGRLGTGPKTGLHPASRLIATTKNAFLNIVPQIIEASL